MNLGDGQQNEGSKFVGLHSAILVIVDISKSVKYSVKHSQK